MLKVITRRLLINLSVILLCLNQVIWASDKDQQQPIYIDSDTASYDEKNSISTYSGNVIYRQGSLVIHSEMMIFHLKNGEIIKVVVSGKPITFKQALGTDKEEMNGQALNAEYYPSTGKLLLMNQAIVKQNGNQANSDLITYDTQNGLIQAGDISNSSKRVHTVFESKGKTK
ncbi:MAG: hypothetical protein RL637_287 [Pseudomonadota bacterium]|jgi:lipopolysaccharide export system protein LptA